MIVRIFRMNLNPWILKRFYLSGHQIPLKSLRQLLILVPMFLWTYRKIILRFNALITAVQKRGPTISMGTFKVEINPLPMGGI